MNTNVEYAIVTVHRR